jgi:N utilization substance protein A
VIKSAVREPGERAKIAVMSNERDVDPVGACVGMKGSRVQAIIRELRGEKIDIIEWSDEPSVFAANALSPAKVNQVRITDIENRQMEVIVNEDQLSLAIGKRGQNVRLATKLVGWNIDIRSEEELKREVTEQMGALIASGESVPLSAIEGVTAQQAEALAGHNINDIDALAGTSVDELVEILDLSFDEAETILNEARAVIAIRDKSLHGAQPSEQEPAAEAAQEFDEGFAEAAQEFDEGFAEPEPSAEAAPEEETEDSTAEGYDEAVESRAPFIAEPEVPAKFSVDPVALTEVEPVAADEINLQEVGRDLRPDTITPTPDITSSGAAALERLEEAVDDGSIEQLVSADDEATTPTSLDTEDAASVERDDEEKQNASPDAAE